MIEENSDEISLVSERENEAADSLDEGVVSERRDSLEPFPGEAVDRLAEDAEESSSPVERRREKRRRQRMLESLADTYGLSGDEALETMVLIDELLPDASRMSTARHVGQRLEHAMRDLKARHPKLLFTREGKGLDMTDPTRFFHPTGAFAKLFDDEEGILRAIVVNRRARVGAERMVSEHDAVEELLLTEYVRRSTLVEQWRHLLPKSMLPIYSMMEAAGVKGSDVRIHAALFNRIRDVIVDWSDGRVDQAQMMKAASRTEEEFLGVLKGKDEEARPTSEDETFDVCRERLQFALEEARADLEELDGLEADEADLRIARKRVERLVTAVSIDAGFDAQGRLVFTSLDSFLEAAAARRKARYEKVIREDDGQAASDDLAVSDAGDDRPGGEPLDMEGEHIEADEASDGEPEAEEDSSSFDGPSADEFGPSMPEELFGPESLEDDDDFEGEEDLGDPSDTRDHPFAAEETASAEETTGDDEASASLGGEPSVSPVGEPSGSPDEAASPLTARASDDAAGAAADNLDKPGVEVDQVETQLVAGLESGADGDEDNAPVGAPNSLPVDDHGLGEPLAPVGEGPLAFDPSSVEDWPSGPREGLAAAKLLPRSSGLSRSTGDEPFTRWRFSAEPSPFCFMGLRLQPDMTAREGQEGPIEPVDMCRMEIGPGQWRAANVVKPSKVLGQSHPLMLPPHSSLAWYGRRLGWSETEIRSLSAFGSPAKPETVSPKGDGVKLADCMRGVARLRLAELAQKVPGHFLADPVEGAERRIEAVEDLARYWIFVLLARHDQTGFDLLFTEGFFHGVHGPDFGVDASGVADFGSSERSGHIGIWSPKLLQSMDHALLMKPFKGKVGDGVMSGVRRLTI